MRGLFLTIALTLISVSGWGSDEHQTLQPVANRCVFLGYYATTRDCKLEARDQGFPFFEITGSQWFPNQRAWYYICYGCP